LAKFAAVQNVSREGWHLKYQLLETELGILAAAFR
jgi:hypothetical protein